MKRGRWMVIGDVEDGGRERECVCVCGGRDRGEVRWRGVGGGRRAV